MFPVLTSVSCPGNMESVGHLMLRPVAASKSRVVVWSVECVVVVWL